MEWEISLLELVKLVRKRFAYISIFVFCCVAVSFIITRFVPRIYKAEATLLPMGGADTPLVRSLVGGFVGNIDPGGQKGSAKQLMVLLQSRTLSERVVQRFDLTKKIYPELWDSAKGMWKVSGAKVPTVEAAASTLRGMMMVKDDGSKGKLIVSINSEDPKLPAELVSFILEELDRFIDDHEISEAKRKRVFVGDQLVKMRRDYLESGKDIAKYYETNYVSPTLSSVDVDIGLEPHFGAMVPKYAFTENMNLSVFAKMDELKEEKEKLERELKNTSIQAVPQHVHLEYLNLKRQLLGQLQSILSEQYAMSLIEEAKEAVAFHVLDEARAPDGPYKPNVRFILGLAFMGSLSIAILAVVFMEPFKRLLLPS